MQFDYRGTIVKTSQPTMELRTIKKIVHVDSGDRDTGIYYTNGEFVVYLPRTYEKVVSVRLMSAEFPSLDFAWQHNYANLIGSNYGTAYQGTLSNYAMGGSNIPSAVWSNDIPVSSSGSWYQPNYFLIDIDGLNKSDATSVASQRSQYTDSFFGKIAAVTSLKAVGGNTAQTGVGGGNSFIEYNDHSGQENIGHYSPPIAKLDRLRIRTRLHSQQGQQGFIYWTTNGRYANALVPVTGTAVFTGTLVGSTLTVSSVASGILAIGQTVTGSGVPTPTVIASGSGTSFTVSSTTGNVVTPVSMQAIGGGSFTGSISGTTLSVSSVASGTIAVGQTVTGTSVTPGTYVTSQLTFTAPAVSLDGTTGTYALNLSSTVSTATTMASTSVTPSSNMNADYAMTFEIEYLDNGFDNFSSMSTRLNPSDRA